MKSFSFFPLTILALFLSAQSEALCRFSYEKRTFVPYGCLPTPVDLPDCSVCKDSTECLSGLCEESRCIQDNPLSRRMCFGPTKLPECAECWEGDECETGRCLNEKCASLTRRSVRKCFGSGRCFRDLRTNERVCLRRRVYLRRLKH